MNPKGIGRTEGFRRRGIGFVGTASAAVTTNTPKYQDGEEEEGSFPHRPSLTSVTLESTGSNITFPCFGTSRGLMGLSVKGSWWSFQRSAPSGQLPEWTNGQGKRIDYCVSRGLLWTGRISRSG
jgi:hypothetical protein